MSKLLNKTEMITVALEADMAQFARAEKLLAHVKNGAPKALAREYIEPKY